MSITARAILADAERCLEQATDEASFRTVVSRSCLAAYHAALEFHQRAMIAESSQDASDAARDEWLAGQLENFRGKEGDELVAKSRSLAYMLRLLLHRRDESDFAMDTQVTISDAVNAHAQARIVLDQSA